MIMWLRFWILAFVLFILNQVPNEIGNLLYIFKINLPGPILNFKSERAPNRTLKEQRRRHDRK